MNCKVLEGDTSKPIVIVHGMLGSSTNWLSLARIMQGRTRRAVFIPDVRNHGPSPHHKSHTYFDLASDIRRLCADRGLTDVTLVAHSMGARAAMLLCLLETDDLVGGLVVVDSSPIHPTTKGGVAVMRKLLDAMLSVDFSQIQSMKHSAAKEVIDKQLEAKGVDDGARRQWILMNLMKDHDSGIYRWQPNVTALSECFESDLLLVPSRHLWTPFRHPTRFLGGDKSGYIPRESHDAIREHFPAADFEYVADAGHWVHADNPKGFMDKLLPFLEGRL